MTTKNYNRIRMISIILFAIALGCGDGGDKGDEMDGIDASDQADTGAQSEADASVTAEIPVDGDPDAPVVEIDGIECGEALGVNTPPVSIGGRDVLVSYPCGKHEGAQVTYILNLHGTQSVEQIKTYQHAYLGAYKYTDSHNIIVTTPKSVVSQWGNGDDGQDEPHIMEVIDWVYQTFSSFEITSMWIAGHSWGSFTTTIYACREDLSDKVTGVVLQSGAPALPECADRLSVISTLGENDLPGLGLPEQAQLASEHGCDEATTYDLGNNTVTEWPNCDPGWVHKNYLMLGKAHGFNPVDWPDEDVTRDIADTIKAAE